MARPRKLPLDRFIELLREMDPEDIAVIPAIIKGFLAGCDKRIAAPPGTVDDMFAEVGERAAGEDIA